MTKIPVLSGLEVIKALAKADWKQARIKGDHVVLTKFIEGRKCATVVPLHKEIDKGTLLEIIRQTKMTREEFLALF
ncbi:MAG: type II toxin-antitoxin system HicA family toxin [Candidatus Aenigmarchaeota archaeon]|nr:type II toxin-antitoxin system HicA family toxin [Candidatus Aenigmarchaeota archaeon]